MSCLRVPHLLALLGLAAGLCACGRSALFARFLGRNLATLGADTRPVLAQTSRVQTPTLVIWGHGDALSPARFGQRLAREIRGSGFELLDAGHAPQEERPREVARLVARILDAGPAEPARPRR